MTILSVNFDYYSIILTTLYSYFIVCEDEIYYLFIMILRYEVLWHNNKNFITIINKFNVFKLNIF